MTYPGNSAWGRAHYSGSGSSPSDFTVNYAGLVLAPGQGGAPRLSSSVTPAVLTNYEPGPVGFLQWFAAAHPQAFVKFKAAAPQLLPQAAALTAELKAGGIPARCPGSTVSGLGSWLTDISSWASSAAKVAGAALGVYGAYKAATASGQVNNNVAAAAAGQQPYAYPTTSGSAVSTGAPPASAVTTTSSIFSGSTGIMLVAGVGIVGTILFVALRKRRH